MAKAFGLTFWVRGTLGHKISRVRLKSRIVFQNTRGSKGKWFNRNFWVNAYSETGPDFYYDESMEKVSSQCAIVFLFITPSMENSFSLPFIVAGSVLFNFALKVFTKCGN